MQEAQVIISAGMAWPPAAAGDHDEIVAGLEPPESAIEAIDWITSVGAVPTVCVFPPVTPPVRTAP